MASRTLQDLTNLGFDQAKVREALQAIGNPADKEAAINWLLDHGEEDRGGTVELKHCPHVEEFSHPFAPQKLIKRSSMAFHNQCHQGCPGSENWCCLLCGETRCGRYAKKHSLAHWEEKKREQEANLTVADAAARKEAIGHCLVLGLSDLTVWCYECQAYVDHGCEPWTFSPETPEDIDAERWQRFVEEVNACVKNNGKYTMTWMISIIALIILTCVVLMVALVSFFTLNNEATMVFVVALATGLGLCFIGGGLITCSGCMALNAMEKVSNLCDALSEELGSEIQVYLAEVKEQKHRIKVVRIRRQVDPPDPPNPPNPEPDPEAVEVSAGAGNAGNDVETGNATQPNQPTD